MRAVVQRVRSASIAVDGELIGEMGEGLLALVGVGREDTAAEAEELARRMIHLRVFEGEDGRMNRSLLEIEGTLGVVSQFTLFGDARKGRRPSFAAAAPAEQAAPLIETVAAAARREAVRVMAGRFQAMMDVALINSGPVTILLDTARRF